MILVGGSSSFPLVEELIKSTVPGIEVKKVSEPLNVVSFGAAIYGLNLSKDTDIIVQDVATTTVGIESVNKLTGIRMVKTLIGKNTELPAVVKKIFAISKDGQTKISFGIYQNTILIDPSKLLGTLELDITCSVKKGDRVEVTITMNVEGIVTIGAKLLDCSLPVEKQLTINLNKDN